MQSTSYLQTLLQWHLEMGVDETIADIPRNWFENSATILSPVSAPLHTQAPEYAPAESATDHAASALQVVSVQIEEAKNAANKATTLVDLIDAIKNFEGCTLKKTAANTVVMDGNPHAKILLIGEAPGQQEDEQGIPFCGPSGKLLDKMLASIGWSRDNCLITNTVYWRPPNNRQPNTQEVMACKPFMEKFIALADPELIIVVGGTAAKALLGTELGITKLHGKMYDYTNPSNNKTYQAGVLFHPSYLLRQPSHKRFAWHDLLMLKQQVKIT